MKIMFVPAKHEVALSSSVKKAIELTLKGKEKIGIVTINPHLDSAKQVIEFLKKELSKEVHIGEGNKSAEKTEILGCDVMAAISIAPKVAAFLYIGDGKFHPIEVYIRTKKPVYIYNPLSTEVYKLDYDNAKSYEKRRIIKTAKTKQAKKIGILLSTKIGQENLKEALRLKEKLEKIGKEAHIIAFDTLNPARLEEFTDIEAFVNTACPRIQDDVFEKPIANLKDFNKMLKD